MPHHAKVLTVSDTAHHGTRVDSSGPAVTARLVDAGFVVVDTTVVPDGIDSVANALRSLTSGFTGVVVTTGGTGFSPRDLTPEATLEVVDRLAPGMAEAMRLASGPLGRLSRAIVGTSGDSLVINLPGSRAGAIECLEAVIDSIPHALDLLAGMQPH